MDQAYRLKRKESLASGVRRIARGRADDALGQIDGVDGEGDLSAAIHEARKDLKKLRSLLRLVREDLGKKAYRRENRRFREAGRLLSSSRDAEVKVETMQALEDRFDGEVPAAASWGLTAALERERDRLLDAGDTVERRLEKARARIEKGRELVRDWPLAADDWGLVEPGLARSYRAARRAMKRVRADPTDDGVHEWRKRVKDLWYQLRIVRNSWKPVLGETADQTHELADLLGEHHDLAVLAEDVRSRGQSADRDRILALIETRQGELLVEAFAIGERVLAEKPKAFSARIEAYWVAWRS